MQNPQNWQLKFWQIPHLDGVEFLYASHVTHDYPPHMHEEYSIGVMLGGTETTICNGRSYEARRGDLLFINAEQVHASSSVNSEYRAFKLWPDALERISVSDRNRPPHLKRDAAEDLPEETKQVESGVSNIASLGVDPTVLAERTLAAIRENLFWVLPPKNDPWREAARLRNRSIDEATNPTLGGPLSGDGF